MANPLLILELVLATLAGGALSSLLLSSWPRVASAVGATTAVGASLVGLAVAVVQLASDGPTASASRPWREPMAAFVVELDALSAFFLVPIFALGAVAAIYGHSYESTPKGRHSTGVAWSMFNLMLAGMSLR